MSTATFGTRLPCAVHGRAPQLVRCPPRQPAKQARMVKRRCEQASEEAVAAEEAPKAADVCPACGVSLAEAPNGCVPPSPVGECESLPTAKRWAIWALLENGSEPAKDYGDVKKQSLFHRGYHVQG
eukprot:evm.model.scf_449.5 EVM.evm.TU.scf_449.5   scf_449:38996-39597(+)